MKALVIAAHPDDEVLGCGGTIAKLVDEGSEVFVAILGEGISSRYDERHLAPSFEIENLQRQSREAASLLGTKEIFFSGFPDNRIDTVPLLEIIKSLEKMIEDLKPDTIYTHHGGDLNIDHSLVHRAVLTATRPHTGSCVKALFTFEIPSSTDCSFGKLLPAFQPNTFVAIDKYLDKKIKAMKIYDSETRTFPHPRSSEALEAVALRWGSIAGMKAAEAFELVRLLMV